VKSIRAAFEGKALTSFGSVATAGANFVLALVLIPRLSKAEYGIYGFCMIAVQLFYNISNALTATPLASDLASGTVGASRLRSYGSVSIALAILAGALMAVTSAHLGASNRASLLLGLFAFFANMRWYGRTYCLSLQHRGSSAASDFVYSTGLLISAVFLYASNANLDSAALGLCFAAVVGLASFFSSGFFSALSARLSDFSAYGEVLRTKAAWALMAVVMAELTINSHAYLVTAFKGAEAYAVLAVVALFFRPTSTMLAAIGQSERPKIGRLINQKNPIAVEKLLREIKTIMLGTVAGNSMLALAAYGVILVLKQEKYAPLDLLIGAGTWAGIMLFRATRLADTIYCQASGKIKEVASISIYAGITSFSSALLLVFLLDNPVFSLVGILAGDAVLYFLTHRIAVQLKRTQFRSWRAGNES